MRWPWLIGGVVCVLAAVLAAALPIALAMRATPSQPLPELGEVPPFTLTDTDGQPFGSDALAGKVWIADFMFTSCPTICPVLSTNLSRVQDELKSRELGDDVILVSISVDPERDTPDVLEEYGKRFGAEPGRWRFLTGERTAIWTLCRDGFHLPVQDNPGNTAEPILHAGKFVLVDQTGTIRGYYDGEKSAVVDAIVTDAARLVKTK